jgi:hypothetical protein
MMPASFWNRAGTMGALSFRRGKNFSALLLTPPPTTNSVGRK